LADYGAEVIKAGPVPARGGVQISPPFYAYSGHRDMQRALFDLKSDAGRDAFLTLAATADVLLESFRPGAVDRLGIGYDAVAAINPGIVYCSTSGYGQTGPRSRWAGHDLNYLAVAGFLDCTGRTGTGGPPIPGATIADAAGGGMQAVMSVLAALVARQRTGEGTYLDVSVADGMLGIMSLFADEHLATGVEPGPGHNMLTGRYPCYDLYPCADGGWVSVAAIEPHFWANLCRALGCEQWIPHQTDDDVADEIRADLAAAFARRTRDEWAAELGPADCCVAPVLSVAEAMADEQYEARGALVAAHHPTGGDVTMVAPPFAGQSRPAAPVTLPDWTRTDTVTLLADAGLDTEHVARLIDDGAIA